MLPHYKVCGEIMWSHYWILWTKTVVTLYGFVEK